MRGGLAGLLFLHLLNSLPACGWIEAAQKRDGKLSEHSVKKAFHNPLLSPSVCVRVFAEWAHSVDVGCTFPLQVRLIEAKPLRQFHLPCHCAAVHKAISVRVQREEIWQGISACTI